MTLTVNHSTPADGTFSAAGAAAWDASHSLTGAIDIANGGTGQTTAAAAITALTGAQTSGRYLRSDGTNAALSAIQAADVPTLNQNTTGTAANVTGVVAVANGGTGQSSYTDGQLLIGNSTGNTLTKATLTAGTGITITNGAGSITIAATNTGTVTSVTGTSPVVSSGGTTPAISLAASYGDTQNPYASKTANYVLAAPNGSAGAPTFRAVVAADIPTLNQNTTGTAANVTGIVAVANGGTGTATPSIVAGTNVTVTGTWPNQTIAASGGGSSTITISNKTAAYTVIAGDLATVINCTSGTFTVSLTAAATLGAGFNVTIFNTGTGAITIDPNGAETIDGVATIILRTGEGTQIICDGTNWLTGNKKTMRGYAESMQATITRPVASGTNSVAIGRGSTASGTAATALGYLASAQNSLGTAIGYSATTGSTADYATAIGANSAGGGSQAVTGLGAMALGGSYASGTDSFAAAVGDNTSTYGAKGLSSVAIGYLANATGTYSLAIGSNTAASGTASVALGNGAQSLQYGKLAFEGYSGFGNGASQFGLLAYVGGTTDGTAKVLTANNGAAGSTNQIILPNSSAYAFTGTVVARQQAAGGTASAAWKVEGLIRREANAGTTTLVASTVTAISNVPGWTLALSADTTNGGLTVTATGAASTNIRWVATIQTSEVTYA